MFVLSITRWRRKLVALMVVVAIIAGLGYGISRMLSPEDAATNAPAENLKKDVLSQPVQVQGQPAAADQQDPMVMPPMTREK